MRILALVLVGWLVACGGSETGDPQQSGEVAREDGEIADAASGASGAPRVEESYQESIDEAWQEAVAGENPSASCAGVKGRAVASEPEAATRALEACNVDIPVRYFLTYIDQVEAGDRTCYNLMTEMMTKLPAMTISAEPFREMAQRDSEADAGDAAAVGAGAAILAGEAAAGGGSNDPRRRIKDRLSERVTEVCPKMAGGILR